LKTALTGGEAQVDAPADPARALEFFAGSGLVRHGLSPFFEVVWANDICKKKAAVYTANFGDGELVVAPIEKISGTALPQADLGWASFPCEDLSLAGGLSGMGPGTRSGLFWHWLRVLDEMNSKSRPKVIVAENVVGFLVAHGGAYFRSAYHALRARGYIAGAIVLDAVWFLPQSRPRAFLVGVHEGTLVEGLISKGPTSVFHPRAVRTAWQAVERDPDWVWWRLPCPPARRIEFQDLCDLDAPCDPPEKTERLLSLLSPANRRKLDAAVRTGKVIVGTGYRRVRKEADGIKRQRFEIRFDGVAGCLRTPEGGSARQFVVIVCNGKIRTRLLTLDEAARLMGAPPGFKLPGTYNDGYRALGDAVAAPVTRWLAQHLLFPLASRARHLQEVKTGATVPSLVEACSGF